MSKELEIVELFLQYKDLLTKHQQKLVEDYYVFDLSLGEISENFNISRQGVYDALKKAKNQLFEYENKLKLKEKNDLLKTIHQNLLAKGFKEEAEEILKVIK
ncbi:MAG: RNA polymerase subunit sigma-70 [Clostridiales bacterium]|nr:RNA polymerase subunit sigma-70 [Clostridiales bacterium]